MKSFIVIHAQIIGDMESGYSEMFSTSGEMFSTATAAHDAGAAATGSDDYIVGVVENGVLARFDDLEFDKDRVAAAAKELCLTGPKPATVPDYKIVSALHFETLENKVKALMNDGWIPQGGVAYATHYVVQAMVRTHAVNIITNIHTEG